ATAARRTRVTVSNTESHEDADACERKKGSRLPRSHPLVRGERAVDDLRRERIGFVGVKCLGRSRLIVEREGLEPFGTHRMSLSFGSSIRRRSCCIPSRRRLRTVSTEAPISSAISGTLIPST